MLLKVILNHRVTLTDLFCTENSVCEIGKIRIIGQMPDSHVESHSVKSDCFNLLMDGTFAKGLSGFFYSGKDAALNEMQEQQTFEKSYLLINSANHLPDAFTVRCCVS
jgi:hypothetical protein